MIGIAGLATWADEAEGADLALPLGPLALSAARTLNPAAIA